MGIGEGKEEAKNLRVVGGTNFYRDKDEMMNDWIFLVNEWMYRSVIFRHQILGRGLDEAVE